MRARRLFFIVGGSLLVILGTCVLALTASEFFFTSIPSTRPWWHALIVILVCPPGMYLGVHWILGVQKVHSGPDRWDSDAPA